MRRELGASLISSLLRRLSSTRRHREQCWCYFLGIEYFFGADCFFGAESKVSDYLQYSQKDSRVTSPDFLEPIQLYLEPSGSD